MIFAIAPLLTILTIAQPIEVSDSNFASWKAYISPNTQELAWQKLKWRYSLLQGALGANEADKPVLLWMESGHPLGCTSSIGIAARMGAWSDPAVQAAAQKFVPVADDFWGLAGRDNPESQLFAKAISQCNPPLRIQPDLATDVIALTPSGNLLGSVSTSNTAALVQMLKDTAEKYATAIGRKMPATPSTGQSTPWRIEEKYPSQGLALKVTCRDVPATGGPESPRTKSWNQDSIWFPKSESESIVPSGVAKDETYRIPPDISVKFAKFAFLDHVKGRTLSFAIGDIQNAVLDAKVAQVSSRSVTIRITGNILATASGIWPINGLVDADHPSEQTRGVDLQILGRASWDTVDHRFTMFELIGMGRRWGATQWNGRQNETSPSPIGFFATLATDCIAPSAGVE